MAASWNLKVYLHPTPAPNFEVFIERATIGVVPGSIVLATGVVFNMTILIFGLVTMRLREATGEVLPTHQFSFRPFRTISQAAKTKKVTVRRARRARQRLKTTPGSGEIKSIDITEVPNR
jgi:hypothetical protein